jgi:hypothetical protein
MEPVYTNVVSTGHVVGLLLMLFWLALLLRERLIKKQNGLTGALTIFVGAITLEKLGAVCRVMLGSYLDQFLSPSTFIEYSYLIWRVLTVWGVVAAILYLYIEVCVRTEWHE